MDKSKPKPIVYEGKDRPARSFRRKHKKCTLCKGHALVLLKDNRGISMQVACPKVNG